MSRTYHYYIYNQAVRSALWVNQATWYPYPLNVENMQIASQALLGEQDFSSFRSSQCESLTPMRNVHWIEVEQKKALVIIRIRANAFLHHMVRNIAGVLMRMAAVWLLRSGRRRCCGLKTGKWRLKQASPAGLYLAEVGYPEDYGFIPPTPTFLKDFPFIMCTFITNAN